MKRSFDYSRGARLVGALLGMAPLPLILAGFEGALTDAPLWKAILAPAAFLCGFAGVFALFRNRRYGKWLIHLFALGTFAVAFQEMLDNPLSALLVAVLLIWVVFSFTELRLRPYPRNFDFLSPRLFGAAVSSLLFSLSATYLHYADAPVGQFALTVSGASVLALQLFRIHRRGDLRFFRLWGVVGCALLSVALLVGLAAAGCFLVSAASLTFLVVSSHFIGSGNWYDRMLRHPARVMFLTFFALAVVGTFLLSLPVSGNDDIPWVDAAFTATSAVCVTGLTTINVGGDLSPAGQVFLLLLVQCGGLGIMSIATIALFAMGRRISLHQEQLMNSLSDGGGGVDLKESLKTVFRYTLGAELAGAGYLFICFLLSGDEPPTALWHGVFLSISAFCNAGFFPAADSLWIYRENSLILLGTGTMIVLGSFAPATALLLPKYLRGQPIPVAARLGIIATFYLIGGGTLMVLLFEWNGVLGEFSFPDKLVNALFGSITLRTAGFCSVQLAGISAPTFFLMTIWMFIGGCPGSTAGGIKTTTAAVLAIAFWSNITNRREITVWDRRVSTAIVLRAATILVAACVVLLFVLIMLTTTQSLPTRSLVFEAVSALGTVGLSLDATPKLDGLGKIIIMGAMFIGRVGPLTIFLLLESDDRASHSRHIDAEIHLT